MKYLFTILVLGLSLISNAQIYIDNEVELTNSNDSLRQIQNLGDVYDSTNLVSAKEIQNSELIFMETVGKDSLIGFTKLGFNPYNAGNSFIVKIDSTITGNLIININGYGYRNILKNVNDTITQGDLVAGQIIHIIYDGANFQMANWIEDFCPSGFVKVNRSYCIERDDNPSATLWIAMQECEDKGARLCTWHEWYYACQKTGLGLNQMTNNYEWINAPVNNPNQCGAMGDGDCITGVSAAHNNNFKYRCCYAR